MDQDQQSRLKELIAKGKEQGFLTYTEVNDHLPEGIVEPEQIEDIIRMINDMGIKVHESAPVESNEILNDTETETDEDAAEEAAAALASLDSEFGRTTDPVRMYMREMGTVELLTREGEIKIARREKKSCPLQCIAMNAMRIIVLKYRTSIREPRSGRCAGSSHLDRFNVYWLFTARFTISFASAGIYLVRPIIGC